MRLFFSYAHVDAVLVGEFAGVLRAAGFDPWWDDRLEPGDDWKAELRSRIASCHVFLYLLSPDSVESEWCGWELAEAAALSKAIVPILIRAGTPLPPVIAHLQYLDASAGLRSVDVARLVGKLARMEQQIRDPVAHQETPAGMPARFRRPLPKNYRTIAQGYLQPLTSHLHLYEWKDVQPGHHPPDPNCIGIDFGTTISSVAVHRDRDVDLAPNDFGETSTPSAVAIAKDGTALVGRRAADFLMLRPERGVLEVKRLFGRDLVAEFGGFPVLEVDGTAYTPVHLAAFILLRLRQDAESLLRSPVRQAVLAAPAYFDASQCSDLVQAAQMAGLEVLRVIPEPVAACMGVRWAAESDLCAMVYDLGGGTFDASIVEVSNGVFEVKAVNGDTRLGGADFDRAIVDYCVRVFQSETGVELGGDPVALMRIREAAERAKIALSSARSSTISVPFITSRAGRGLNLEVELTRTRVNELTAALVDRTVRLLNDAIEDAGLTPAEIAKVLVVGRAARAAGIHLALEDTFGQRLQTAPDHVVALGAALQGGVLAGGVKEWLLLDSLSHTLRVQVAGGRCAPLMVRNTTIPNIKNLTLTAQSPGQTRMLVRILTGESSWADQNLPFIELQVDCRATPTACAEVELTVEIDANSLVSVTVRDADGSLKGRAECGLRQHVRLPASATWDEAFFPKVDHPVRLSPLPDSERVDFTLAQQWLSRSMMDLLRERRGHEYGEGSRPGFADERILQYFSLERELLVDVLEERYRKNLTDLRYSSSINAMARELVTALSQ